MEFIVTDNIIYNNTIYLAIILQIFLNLRNAIIITCIKFKRSLSNGEKLQFIIRTPKFTFLFMYKFNELRLEK